MTMKAREAAPAGSAIRRRGPGRSVAAILMLASGGLLFALTQSTWVTVNSRGLAGSLATVDVMGRDATPAVVACALVALASGAVFAFSRGSAALIAATVAFFAGVGAVTACGWVLADPVSASQAKVAEATGLSGAGVQASVSALAWIAGAVGMCLAAASVYAALTTRRAAAEPGTSRFTRDTPVPAPKPNDRDQRAPDALDSVAAWDSLSRGEDPTR